MACEVLDVAQPGPALDDRDLRLLLGRVRVHEHAAAGRERADRLEQVARARHGESRRERRAAGGRSAAPSQRRCRSQALVDRRASRFAGDGAARPRRRPSCTCRSTARSPVCGHRLEHRVRIVHGLHRQHRRRAAREQFAGRQARRRPERGRRVRGLHRPDARAQPVDERRGRRRSRGTASGRGGCASGRSPAARARPTRRSTRVVRARVDAARPPRCGRRGPTTSPSTTSKRSFIVRMVPPRMSREAMRLSYRRSVMAVGGDVGRRSPRRTAISSATMLTAISSGVTAPICRPIGRVDAREPLGATRRLAASASMMRATLARLPIMPT